VAKVEVRASARHSQRSPPLQALSLARLGNDEEVEVGSDSVQEMELDGLTFIK